MIKTRLIRLLSQSKKYIIYQVLWQWLALLVQIVAIIQVARLLEEAVDGRFAVHSLPRAGVIFVGVIAVRFVCERMAAKASYMASVDVKHVLREKIYDKMLRLGASYKEQVSTSEVVQVCSEGVEQLETYFGRYLPQLFYSLLAPVTLFVVLSFVSFKASLVLLLCVPLIPVSIVLVQKIAKKLLSKYWSIYTGLGDSFLENLQGLTTLKIYQADEKKATEMDEESEYFRKITMKVLITGTSQGIGKAIAEKFLSNGHFVIGIDRQQASITDDSYVHYQCDIRDFDTLPQIDDIEILINNAGTQNEGDIDTNLKALIKLTEKYGIRAGIRSILNIGSASGHTGAEFPEYCASKGGVIAYTKNVALRVAPFGATCNSLDPGGVLTPLNDCVVNDPELWNEIMEQTPLRRWASSEEIAQWAYFLTVENSFCTGQSIVVDGGESINSHFVWPTNV